MIAYDVLADASGNEGVFDRFRISPSLFQAGENLIAVELHQRSRGSSDLVFDMEILAKEPLVANGETLQLEWDAVWESGELDQFTVSQQVPSAPIRAGRTYRARVRHKDDTGRWSHWSEALQFIASEPDTALFADSIVISEIMYHPAEPSPAEKKLGYTAGDFEYLEITNIGDLDIDLTGLRFTKGVDFDFLGSGIVALSPGEHALVAANRAAFEYRHGSGRPIAGEWEPGDRLSNGGERLKLSFGAGFPIRDFQYLDESPWPSAPDGSGFSLTLIDPRSNPKHGDPASWRSSVNPGGSPGEQDSSNFAEWVTGFNLSPDEPDLDNDQDGLSLFREYAQGGNPLTAVPDEGLFNIEIEELVRDQVPASYLILKLARNMAADDVSLRIEWNPSLLTGQWQDVTEDFVLHADRHTGRETTVISYRRPLPENPSGYWRIRFTGD